MAPSDNSFTDNLSAIDRIYADRAEVETDKDGKIPHIDVDNENMDGPPVDLANVGVPVAEESQAEETELYRPSEEGTLQDPDAFDHEEDEDETVDPDELTEAELEAATAPEGEEA